ncbi:hypothetical protein DPMN_019566 [Dreissena polymorpha]|uniref:Uncharacterized protein n=1 Tax=Dreissena polymorpha TaxID=45954 RepID=A0A9D4NF92_DREPO|nr:hypothetical protein DPMN_019566 [Dreissena polymorpha]
MGPDNEKPVLSLPVASFWKYDSDARVLRQSQRKTRILERCFFFLSNCDTLSGPTPSPIVTSEKTNGSDTDGVAKSCAPKLIGQPGAVARLCGRPTLVGRQLTTRRVQGASCRDCGRTTEWSVILHGFWLPTKRQATNSQATSSRGVRGGLRSKYSTSNNARSTDDRRSPFNPVIVARRLFSVARLSGRPTLVGRQLTTCRVQGASCRDCGRTTVWSVILHGFWLPTKRQATSSQATSSRGVRGGLRSLYSTSNSARSTDDRRSPFNPVIVA